MDKTLYEAYLKYIEETVLENERIKGLEGIEPVKPLSLEEFATQMQ